MLEINYTLHDVKGTRPSCTVWGRLALVHELDLHSVDQLPPLAPGGEVVIGCYRVTRNPDRERPTAGSSILGRMIDYCPPKPKHPTLARSEIDEVARQLANLRYDALASVLRALALKLEADSASDLGRYRVKLAHQLSLMAMHLTTAASATWLAWTICSPHMKEPQPKLQYPCCEAVHRVELVPGDATTLVGGRCPIHGPSYYFAKEPK